MKHLVIILISISAITTLFCCGGPPSFEPDSGLDFVDGKHPALKNSYIVAFRPRENMRQFSDYLSEYKHHYSLLSDTFLSDPRIKDINFITSLDISAAKVKDESFSSPTNLMWGGETSSSTASIAKVDFSNSQAAKELLKEWQEQGATWYSEPNYLNDLKTSFSQWSADTEAMAQWWQGSSMLNLSAAFSDIASGNLPNGSSESDVLNNSPIIAVLDSGVDVEHPALRSNIFVNESPGQAGCAGDTYGCDTTKASRGTLGVGDITPFLYSSAVGDCPYPEAVSGSKEHALRGVCQHGTHVAGIIAAAPDQTTMVGGVCPVCKILAVKIITNVGGSGRAPDSAILNGLKYITQFRKSNSAAVRVVNSSFGKYARSRSVALVVSLLKKHMNGVLVVGAASNEDSMSRTYPGALNEAIAVGAVDEFGRKAFYSNFGPWVDVSAPGGSEYSQIRSTIPGGSTYEKKGTSMACPVVAGLAGLLLAADPGKSFDALRSSIINGANPGFYNADFEGGFNYNNYYPKISGEVFRVPLLGSGIIDAKASLQGTKATTISATQLSRVVGGCGVVNSSKPLVLLPLMILFMIPITICASKMTSFARTMRRKT